jgi:hypothetical protein
VTARVTYPHFAHAPVGTSADSFLVFVARMLLFAKGGDDTPPMANDDETLVRLRALAERLERLRQQAKEVHDVASDEVRSAHLSTRQRKVPSGTERRVAKRS